MTAHRCATIGGPSAWIQTSQYRDRCFHYAAILSNLRMSRKRYSSVLVCFGVLTLNTTMDRRSERIRNPLQLAAFVAGRWRKKGDGYQGLQQSQPEQTGWIKTETMAQGFLRGLCDGSASKPMKPEGGARPRHAGTTTRPITRNALRSKRHLYCEQYLLTASDRPALRIGRKCKYQSRWRCQ